MNNFTISLESREGKILIQSQAGTKKYPRGVYVGPEQLSWALTLQIINRFTIRNRPGFNIITKMAPCSDKK